MSLFSYCVYLRCPWISGSPLVACYSASQWYFSVNLCYISLFGAVTGVSIPECLTHIYWMDLSIHIIWMSPFWILGVSCVLFLFFFFLIFDRKSFKQTVYTLIRCRIHGKIVSWGFILTKVPFTVMILSFRTDTPGQTVQTQIRLLLEEQSDQGLHCLPFRLHRLDSLLYGRAT